MPASQKEEEMEFLVLVIVMLVTMILLARFLSREPEDETDDLSRGKRERELVAIDSYEYSREETSLAIDIEYRVRELISPIRSRKP